MTVVNLNSLVGPCGKFELAESCTVAELRQEVLGRHGLSSDMTAKILLGERVLHRDQRLSDLPGCERIAEDPLELSVVFAKATQVNVGNLSGNYGTYYLQEDETVGDLKRRISERSMRPATEEDEGTMFSQEVRACYSGPFYIDSEEIRLVKEEDRPVLRDEEVIVSSDGEPVNLLIFTA